MSIELLAQSSLCIMDRLSRPRFEILSALHSMNNNDENCQDA